MSSDSNAPTQEFIDWLAKLSLSHYQDAACEWWVANGAISLSEVIENWEAFATDLQLKPLERKRVEKDAASASSNVQLNPRLSQEVSDWLQELHLSHYTVALLQWCKDTGASSMAELRVGWEDFAEALAVKPFERMRIERDVTSRMSAPPAFPPRPLTLAEKGVFGPPEDPRKYQLIEEIGFGVTSKVWKCQRGKDTYAVKIISLKRLRHQPGFTRMEKRLHQEIEILLSLKHEHIVKLVDVVEEEDCLYLVMELISGGELGEWIVKKGVFDELSARHVFMQIAEGLAYIHSKGIIHRDLKPDNILVDEASTAEKLAIKLSDFGHSRLINDGSTSIPGLQRRLTARIGTAMYWAPEVSDPNRAAMGYDQSADLWSLGVVLYVMLIGFFPFENGDHLGDRLQQDVNSLTFRPRSSGPELSSDAQDLLRSLLVIDPQKRLPLTQCLGHRWTSGQLDSRLEYMKLATDPNPTAVEVRVPLIVKPEAEALQLLRVDLQKWMYKFRRFAAMRHGEVIANLGESSQADLPESKAARRELQAIVERHCGRGMIVVNDRKMWTAIAESKNETLHCPVSVQPAIQQPERGAQPERCHPVAASPAAPKRALVLLTRGANQAAQTNVEMPEPNASHSAESEPCQSQPTADSGCDARLAVAALQGFWESQRDPSETYTVHGLDVTRHQWQNSSMQKRPYSLRWNPERRCLEWGSGKYFLQMPPSAEPMMEAVWLARDGGRGFAWRRSAGKGKGKTGKGKGKSRVSQGEVGGDRAPTRY